MSKELEASYTPKQSLNNIRYHYFHNKGGTELEYFWFNKVEKSLKALEIIKEKKVDTLTLYICFEKYDLKTFNMTINNAKGEKPLTQEEYDLLKEMLL